MNGEEGQSGKCEATRGGRLGQFQTSVTEQSNRRPRSNKISDAPAVGHASNTFDTKAWLQLHQIRK